YIGECHENDGVHRSSGRIFKVTWDEPEDLYRAEAVPDGDHPLAQEGKRFPVPAAARQAADLATLSNAQLVSLQRSYDEWTARTAHRLLQERAAAGESVDDAVAALDWMIEADKSTVHTLRAMWSLFVMGELTSDRIRPLL